ncbi:hypothetical protein ACR9PT_10080 [Piscirickettsia salmonis]|uniref:hypothetical protein n=1 Tax=Piscirickettsia salmonis TaxID=1238 RepID=UPI003EC0BD46
MLGDFASLDVQNTYRGSDAYVFPRIVAILENKPEQGLAMADGRCAKQVILEAIAQYIKVIEEKLPSYKDMALVFKIRNFFSEKLPSYIPEPEPEMTVDIALDEKKQEQDKLQSTKKVVTGLKSRQASSSITIPAGVNLEPGAVLGSSKWQKLLQAIEQAKQLYADEQLNKALLLSRYLEQQLASFNPFEYFEEELSGLACLKAVLMPYEAEIESARQSNAMVWQRAGEVCDMSISAFIEQVDDNVLAAQERREEQDKTMSIDQIKQDENTSPLNELDKIVSH